MSKKAFLLVIFLLVFVIFPLLYIFFTVTFFTWGLTIEFNNVTTITQRTDDLIALAKVIYEFITELLVTIIDLIKPLLHALIDKVLGEG